MPSNPIMELPVRGIPVFPGRIVGGLTWVAVLMSCALAIPGAPAAEAQGGRRLRPTSSSSFPTTMPIRPSAPMATRGGSSSTPNIDRLAREGMRFDRCLVPNSICGPSRATVLTGKYSHANGFYNNTNSRFDGSQTTFPKLLRAAGYQTAIFGKWHLVSEPTGFDEWHILPGQGVYYNPPMLTPRGKVSHQGYVTDIITELSLDWLKKRDRSKPFLLMCQHKAPHRDWQPALRHLGHDHDRRYPEPPTLFDDYAGRGKAEHQQDMTIARTMGDNDLKLVAARRAIRRPALRLERLLRAAQRGFSPGRPHGQRPGALEVQSLSARLPRVHQGRG